MKNKQYVLTALILLFNLNITAMPAVNPPIAPNASAPVLTPADDLYLLPVQAPSMPAQPSTVANGSNLLPVPTPSTSAQPSTATASGDNTGNDLWATYLSNIGTSVAPAATNVVMAPVTTIPADDDIVVSPITNKPERVDWNDLYQYSQQELEAFIAKFQQKYALALAANDTTRMSILANKIRTVERALKQEEINAANLQKRNTRIERLKREAAISRHSGTPEPGSKRPESNKAKTK